MTWRDVGRAGDGARSRRRPGGDRLGPTAAGIRAPGIPRTLLVVLFAALLGGFGLLGTLPASAHNVLESLSPADGSTVQAVPQKIVMTFDQPAEAIGSAIELDGPGGPAAVSAPVLVDNTVAITTGGELPAGRYTARWRITSADGHPISGSWTFTAGAAASYPAPEASGTAGGGSGTGGSAFAGPTGGPTPGGAASGGATPGAATPGAATGGADTGGADTTPARRAAPESDEASAYRSSSAAAGPLIVGGAVLVVLLVVGTVLLSRRRTNR